MLVPVFMWKIHCLFISNRGFVSNLHVNNKHRTHGEVSKSDNHASESILNISCQNMSILKYLLSDCGVTNSCSSVSRSINVVFETVCKHCLHWEASVWRWNEWPMLFFEGCVVAMQKSFLMFHRQVHCVPCVKWQKALNNNSLIHYSLWEIDPLYLNHCDCIVIWFCIWFCKTFKLYFNYIHCNFSAYWLFRMKYASIFRVYFHIKLTGSLKFNGIIRQQYLQGKRINLFYKIMKE